MSSKSAQARHPPATPKPARKADAASKIAEKLNKRPKVTRAEWNYSACTDEEGKIIEWDLTTNLGKNWTATMEMLDQTSGSSTPLPVLALRQGDSTWTTRLPVSAVLGFSQNIDAILAKMDALMDAGTPHLGDTPEQPYISDAQEPL